MAKVKKRALSIALVLAMLLSLSVTAFAAQNDISIELDGKKVAFTSESGKPFVDVNGRTQVPLRVVMEQYGCDVKWDSMSSTAIITKGSTTVTVPIGKSYITVNGKNVPMDTSALVQDGHTYLPIRAVLEAFGANVKWDNGKVSVTSASAGGFDNIYVDDDGDLIFELANGSKINAGSVSSGKDGKDGKDGKNGISVTDAYVDAGGDLMIKLSSGRTINAGNVGTGGSLSGLTFADYAVGTKFYLIQPTGEFDVPVTSNGKDYTIHFDEVYYELTANYTGESNAWVCTESNTVYAPYRATMHIEGSTDSALAGCKLSVSFLVANGAGTAWGYTARITDDGSFTVSVTQGENGTTPWNAPKNLVLNKVTLNTVRPTPEPDPEPDYSEYIKAAAGTYRSLPEKEDGDVLVLSEDGTLTYNGKGYTPEFMYDEDTGMLLTHYINGIGQISFDSANKLAKVGAWRTFYKDGSYIKVDLSELQKTDFDQYFERKDVIDIREIDKFGKLTRASAYFYYCLKDEWKLAEMEEDSTSPIASIKANVKFCNMTYQIDLDSKTWTLTRSSDENESSREATFNSDYLYAAGKFGFQLQWESLNNVSGTVYAPVEFEVTEGAGILYLILNSSTTTD